MKQVVALLLICLSFFMLCACGGNVTQEHKETQSATTEATITAETSEPVLSKEEMLEKAEKVDAKKLGIFSSNQAKAKSSYSNKVLEVEGFIGNIKEDHVRLTATAACYVDVFLPVEDIVELIPGQKIIIVGILDDTIVEEESITAGSSFTHTIISMSTAYLVQDKYEVSGKVTGRLQGDTTGSFWFKTSSQPDGTNLWFAEGVDTTDYETGTHNIKILTRITYIGDWREVFYKDAIPIN